MRTVDMVAAQCGNFSLYCAMRDHFVHGMEANFIISASPKAGCPSVNQSSAKRTIYLQAETMVCFHSSVTVLN